MSFASFCASDTIKAAFMTEELLVNPLCILDWSASICVFVRFCRTLFRTLPIIDRTAFSYSWLVKWHLFFFFKNRGKNPLFELGRDMTSFEYRVPKICYDFKQYIWGTFQVLSR